MQREWGPLSEGEGRPLHNGPLSEIGLRRQITKLQGPRTRANRNNNG